MPGFDDPVETDLRGRGVGPRPQGRRGVHPDGPAAGRDTTGGQKQVGSGPATDVEHRLARLHRTDAVGVAEPGKPRGGLGGQRLELGAVVTEKLDGVVDTLVKVELALGLAPQAIVGRGDLAAHLVDVEAYRA